MLVMMAPMKLLAVSAAVMCLALPAQAAPLSVCDLLAGGAKLNGRSVRVHATWQTDYQHFSFLADKRCLGAIDLGVMGHASQQLDRAVDNAMIGRSQTTFDIEVSGKFIWDPHWQPPALLSAVVRPGPHGTLMADRIWSIRPSR